MEKLLHSFSVMFEGFRYLLSRPKLWHLVFIPFLLSLLFGCGLGYGLFDFSRDLIDKLLAFNFFQEYDFLLSILKVFGTLLSVFLTLWLFTSISIIIQSPFNGFIAEKILDEYKVNSVVEYSGLKLVLFEIGRSTVFEITKLILGLSFFILTFFLNVIPGIGSIVFTLLNLAFALYMTTLDLFDPAYSRLNLSFGEKTKQVFKNWKDTFGLSVFAVFLVNIPIINLLFWPIGTTAAMLTFAKTIVSEMKQK